MPLVPTAEHLTIVLQGVNKVRCLCRDVIKKWDSLWREWQEKRNQIRNTLESIQPCRQTYITNLDPALEIISHVGIVYNILSCDDRHELLWQKVEQVIVDSQGNVSLKLLTPFAYLKDISDEVRSYHEETEDAPENTKIDELVMPDLQLAQSALL